MSALSTSAGYSYFGAISSVQEAHAVLEASKQGILPRVTRRLTDEERARFVRAGAVFVWEEEEASIRRWTDHLKWSPSRVSGAFLTYTELPARDDDTLIKQSFSSVDAQGCKMHLIAYYSKAAFAAGLLPFVAQDPLLAHLVSQRTSSTSARLPTFPSGPSTNPPPTRTLFPPNYFPAAVAPSIPSRASFPLRHPFSSTLIPTPPQSSYTPSDPAPGSHSSHLHSTVPALLSLRNLLDASLPPAPPHLSPSSHPRQHPFYSLSRRSSDPNHLRPLPPPLPPHSISLPPSLSSPYPPTLQLPSLHIITAGVPIVPPLTPPLPLPFLETALRRGSRGAEDERQLGLLGRTF